MKNQKTIDFLQKWKENGPWVLTAINPSKKSIETATFLPTGLEALDSWLTERVGVLNLYFHVNSVTRLLKKKAQREDIKTVDYLHVDIDPLPGQDIKAERTRILNQLTDNLPKGLPEPTVIVFSGGGFQAFWKLKTPIEINGDLGLAEEAKRYNLQLEVLFSADNCHNIDRIMRLPYSINIPDAKKRQKGRVEEEATLVKFDQQRAYDLSDFKPAAPVQTSNKGLSDYTPMQNTINVDVSGNIRRIEELDELDEYDVPDRVKVIIAQGHHPDQPKDGDNSRSSWLFDATCNLVRCKVPDELIYSILTDPGFAIAESVLEQSTNSHKYALRQINKAKEHAIDPQLAFLNEKFAVIGNMGGKCVVVEERLCPVMKRATLSKITFEHFRNRFLNKKVKIGEDGKGNEKTTSLGRWWLLHEERKYFDSVIFAPNMEIEGTYNLWRGFSVNAIPGTCDAFLEHVKTNICAGDEGHYNYLVGWMARAVQFPALPGEVAVVLKGGQGNGKGTFARAFGQLFGRHFLHLTNSGHLTGNFNAHLRDACVVFADEAFFAGDKKHRSVLKTLITEDTIAVEAKNVDVETAPNFIHMIMASNEDHVVPAGHDERRYFVLNTLEEKKQNSEYFQKIYTELENGGKEALLHFLTNWDLSNFNVRKVPQTQALQQQKLLSLTPEEEWWFQKLIEGVQLSRCQSWLTYIPKSALVRDYTEMAKQFNINYRGTVTSLGQFLKKIVPGLKSTQRVTVHESQDHNGITQATRKREYHYVFPSLAECRIGWQEKFGKQDWDEFVIETEYEQAPLNEESPF